MVCNTQNYWVFGLCPLSEHEFVKTTIKQTNTITKEGGSKVHVTQAITTCDFISIKI
jgi:hypothetical protein